MSLRQEFAFLKSLFFVFLPLLWLSSSASVKPDVEDLGVREALVTCGSPYLMTDRRSTLARRARYTRRDSSWAVVGGAAGPTAKGTSSISPTAATAANVRLHNAKPPKMNKKHDQSYPD